MGAHSIGQGGSRDPVEIITTQQNQDKTQHIWFGSRAQLSKIDFGSLRFRFPNVHFSTSVRDLGFILDPSSLYLIMSI